MVLMIMEYSNPTQASSVQWVTQIITKNVIQRLEKTLLGGVLKSMT